jgi:hypothetical protein
LDDKRAARRSLLILLIFDGEVIILPTQLSSSVINAYQTPTPARPNESEEMLGGPSR